MSRIKTNRSIPKTSIKDDTKPSLYIGMSKPVDLAFTSVSLASQTSKGAKKNTPIIKKYKGSASILTTDIAEYLYLTNGYVACGVDKDSEAVVRNGFTIKPNNSSDQEAIDLFLKTNNLTILLKDIDRYVSLYGQPMVEMFPDKVNKTTKLDILPPTEMDYLRDGAGNIQYDTTTGEPAGYTQKRDGQYIATWSGEDAKRIIVFKYKTLGGYIEGIPGIQNVLYPATEYGNIRGNVADSFIRSMPVCHWTIEDADEEDLREIQNAVGPKFTARTLYITSQRYEIENKGPNTDIDIFKFVEPTLSEIAACFSMPIEMIAATQYLKANGNDYQFRYSEWIEHVKMKQKIIASILEQKVFAQLFKDGVTVTFNNPATVNVNDLMKNTGYAVQSGAIDAEMALEILVRNQVFGNFTEDMLRSKTDVTPISDVDSTNKSDTSTNNTE